MKSDAVSWTDLTRDCLIETECLIVISGEFHKDPFEDCGLPLGLRVKPQTDLLYFVDAFHGVFKIDLLTWIKHQVLSSKDSRFGKATPKLLNDLDLDGDNIYFIDSSFKHSAVTGADEIVEMRARGRLFKYNEKTDELELLLENIYMPNGLQLVPSKEAVLINECTIARILKYSIWKPIWWRFWACNSYFCFSKVLLDGS